MGQAVTRDGLCGVSQPTEVPGSARDSCLGLVLHLERPSTHLQQARELAVPKVDVLRAAALLTQRVDAVAQRQQRAVDVRALLHPLATVLGLWERPAEPGTCVPPRSHRARSHGDWPAHPAFLGILTYSLAQWGSTWENPACGAFPAILLTPHT